MFIALLAVNHNASFAQVSPGTGCKPCPEIFTVSDSFCSIARVTVSNGDMYSTQGYVGGL